MKIFVVRHGQTIWNKEAKMQGSADSPLTELGILEATKLGEALMDKEIDKIYTSPLGRTIKTTEYIKGNRDIPVSVIDELQEINFGNMEGKPVDIIQEKYGEIIYNFWNDPLNYKNNTGESFHQVYERVKKGMSKIIENRHKEKNVVVVTHGVIISVLLSWVNGGSIEDTWKTPIVNNTSVSTLKYNGEGILELLNKNDISHLK